MLILTRRVSEKLITDVNGEIIDVMVLGIKGNQVKIGVQASDSVTIDREEIYLLKNSGGAEQK